MSEISPKLGRFRKRVRMVSAWKAAGLGAIVGGSAGIVFASLDFFGVFLSDWAWIAAPMVAGVVIGAVFGYFRRIGDGALAESIDRRAKLKDRVATAHMDPTTFGAEIQGDALSHLESLRPKDVYPVRVTRWHAGGLAMGVVAASIFLLGNTPLLLSSQEKADREELKKAAEALERVAKPVLERKSEEVDPKAKDLAKKMEQFARELEKGRLPKEEALQKANELAKEAEKTSREKFDESDRNLEQAEQAMDGAALDKALQEMGLSDAELSEIDKAELQRGAKMSDAERNQAMQDLQRQLNQVERQLSEGRDAGGNELSQDQKDALKKQAEALRKKMKSLELSVKVKDFLKRLFEHPDFKELLKLMKELREKNEQMKQNPQGTATNPPEVTEQQIKEMMKKLEELADKIGKDDKAMREFIEKLKQAMLNANGACQGMGLCMGLGGLAPSWGPSGPGQDNWFKDIGMVPQKDNPEDIDAKADPKAVRGDRQEEGEETYIEVRGPSKAGERSKTPYFKVLPQYRKRAEEALDKERIPREHQKRVKDYFESLTQGKK